MSTHLGVRMIIVPIMALLSSISLMAQDTEAAPVLSWERMARAQGATPAVFVTAEADWMKALKARPGWHWGAAASAVGSPNEHFRVVVWKSVKAAEDAAMALDGRPEAAAVDKLVGGRAPRTWFRQLRSKSYSETRAGHVEVVVFRLKTGDGRDDHLKRYDEAEAGFSKADGLLGHSLWIAPDGSWMHLLRWKSAAAFEKTGKGLMRVPSVGGWVRSLDFRRFRMVRGDVAKEG